MALLFAPETERQLAAMPEVDRGRILKALRDVAAEPGRRFSFVTELQGRPGVWRLRKGDWRAVYQIDAGDVVIERIAHRKEIYR